MVSENFMQKVQNGSTMIFTIAKVVTKFLSLIKRLYPIIDQKNSVPFVTS